GQGEGARRGQAPRGAARGRQGEASRHHPEGDVVDVDERLGREGDPGLGRRARHRGPSPRPHPCRRPQPVRGRAGGGRVMTELRSTARGFVDRRAESTPAEVFTIPVWEAWTDDALCSQTDPESFYPEKGGSTREAKAV